jgi:phosphotransacetylase
MSSIQKTIETHLCLSKEYNEIKKEIADFRKHYKQSLQKLEAELQKTSDAIQEYLQKYNHDAVTYNGIRIQIKNSKKVKGGKIISRKKKEANLKNIISSYNLPDECVRDIENSIIGVQENDTKICFRKEKFKKK